MEANPFPYIIPNAMWHPVSFPLLTTTPSQAIFVCPPAWYARLRAVSRSFTTASTSGTAMLEVLTTGQVADAGIDQLTATLPLSGTINTPVNGTLIREPTVMKPGDRLGIVIAGTMTNLAGCCLTAFLEVLNRGQD